MFCTIFSIEYDFFCLFFPRVLSLDYLGFCDFANHVYVYIIFIDIFRGAYRNQSTTSAVLRYIWRVLNLLFGGLTKIFTEKCDAHIGRWLFSQRKSRARLNKTPYTSKSRERIEIEKKRKDNNKKQFFFFTFQTIWTFQVDTYRRSNDFLFFLDCDGFQIFNRLGDDM